MKAIEINKMTKIERLQTMEALWDSLIHEQSEIESPEWHRGVLELPMRRAPRWVKAKMTGRTQAPT